jgi:hypothetical protein
LLFIRYRWKEIARISIYAVCGREENWSTVRTQYYASSDT